MILSCFCTSVLFTHLGEGGIGKTSSLGMLALDWAENAKEELNPFKFVFLISLRHVDGNEPLESIIMSQHGRLRTEKVPINELKTILWGKTKYNILILVDGYDEYTPGCDEIDDLLTNGKDNCLVILSSRPGDFLTEIKRSMDEEVTITGLSYENIIRCAKKYLGSHQSCETFLSQAEQAGIHICGKPKDNNMRYYEGLLHIPIILLFACTVFREKHHLPSSKTGLFQQVIHMCISRTTLKTMGKTARQVENLQELLVCIESR